MDIRYWWTFVDIDNCLWTPMTSLDTYDIHEYIHDNQWTSLTIFEYLWHFLTPIISIALSLTSMDNYKHLRTSMTTCWTSMEFTLMSMTPIEVKAVNSHPNVPYHFIGKSCWPHLQNVSRTQLLHTRFITGTLSLFYELKCVTQIHMLMFQLPMWLYLVMGPLKRYLIF